MHIKSITIDGFKSYNQKTVIKDFDREFNAITGPNGSGKSNILDAICFVLGLSVTKLQAVRASNLEDLINNRGASGITKASVTIEFDNSDEKTSPAQYAKDDTIFVTREIVLNGGKKYYINSAVAKESQVHDLFKSVQLDVNNPHFLIMQGRITKVLRMDSKETLRMIEESARTSKFESSKNSSLAQLSKKEGELNDIQEKLNREIVPQLSKTSEEAKKLKEYQSLSFDLDRKMRYYHAFEYTNLKTEIEDITRNREEKKTKLSSFDKNLKEQQEKLDELKKEIGAISEMTKKGSMSLSKLEAEEADACNKKAKIDGKIEGIQKTIEEKRAEVRKYEKDLEKKKHDVEKWKQKIADAESATNEKEDELNRLDREIQSLKTQKGMSEKGLLVDENGVPFSETLSNLERQYKSDENEYNTHLMRLKNAEDSHNRLQKEYNGLKSRYDKIDRQIKDYDGLIANNEAKISHLLQGGFDPIALEKMNSKWSVLKTELADLNDKKTNVIDKRSSYVPKLEFNNSKCPGVLRGTNLFGFVVELFSVRDQKYSYALEMASGNKLTSVVVDTDVTATSILKADLRQRVTFLPLSKMTSRPITDDQLAELKKKVGETVVRAIDLVSYDPKFDSVMMFVWGNVLVCENRDVAHQISRSNNIRATCVTLDGDVFEMDGTVSGGSKSIQPVGKGAPASRSKLDFFTEYRSLMAETSEKNDECVQLKRDIDGMKHLQDQYDAAQAAIDNARTQREKLNQDPQAREFTSTVQNLKTSEETLTKMREAVSLKKEKLQEISSKRKDIERRLDAAKDALKKNSLQVEISNKEKTFEECKKSLEMTRNSVSTYQSSLHNSEQVLNSVKEDCERTLALIADKEKELAAEQAEFVSVSSKYEEIKDRLDAKKTEEEAQNIQLQQLENKRVHLERLIQNANTDKAKLKEDVEEMGTNLTELTQKIRQLENDHEFILKDRQFFGMEHSDYDFSGRDFEEVEADYKKCTKDLEKLRRKVDKDAQVKFESLERSKRSIEERLQRLQEDRQKVLEVIEQLDEKKRKVLVDVSNSVNKHFGSIFSSLLPNVSARLKWESDRLEDGLRIQVAFNGVWKETLEELSGGQKSLLALSLILALLKQDPAPVYILDEVDAALDLSHTQNIGRMIKEHFQQAQFIIVSLKEGMFSNANVIYRTAFVDGTSTVTRTTNVHGRHRLTDADAVQNENKKRKV